MTSISIPLHSQKYPDLCAVIDEADAELVMRYRWHLYECHPGSSGSIRYAKARAEDGRKIFLHRLIAAAPSGTPVDHVNGDGLDNRRINLRLSDTTRNNCAGPAGAGLARRARKAQRKALRVVGMDGRRLDAA